ncbi:conserved membrane hypothetical protein [Syntrophobacter sp. SbD1]|nr:conserved membrane hypothetical protein [Syntrophobacter sp. SbD1]
MDTSNEKSKGLHGIAALFDDMERKDLFRKYLYFLCWVELGILITCWLYQISDSGRDGESTFPWHLYFLIAFLAPVAITFLVGTVVTGFNRYFAEPEQPGQGMLESEAVDSGGEGRTQQLSRMVEWLQRLPFLALLLLLGVGIAFFYKLNAIVSVIGGIGEKSVKIVLISAGVILFLGSIFALILIILNYRLRKTAMEYQYKTQVAEKFGLVILEDNTVLNSSGKLLVNGSKFKKAALQLLPGATGENNGKEKNPQSKGFVAEDPVSGPGAESILPPCEDAEAGN